MSDGDERRRDPRLQLALAGIILVALGLRIYHLGEQAFWIDEIRAVLRPGDADLLTYVRDTFGPIEAPLSFLIVEGFRHLPFDAETAARLPFALAGVAEVIGTYLLARRLVGRDREALLAASFVAVAPFAIRYSQEARYYTLYSALHLFCWWALFRALDRARRGWLVWTVLACVIALTHPFAPLMLAAQLVYVVGRSQFVRGRVARRDVYRVRRGIVIAIVAALPWLVYEAVEWVPAVWGGESIALRAADSAAPSFNLDLVWRGASWLLANSTPGHARLGLAIGALALVAPLAVARFRRPAALGMLGYVVGTSIVVVLFARLVHTYFAYRRVEFLTPVLLILVAMTIGGIADRIGERTGTHWHAVAFTVAVSLLLVVRSAQADVNHFRSEKTGFDALAELIDTAPATDLIVLGHFNDDPKTAWDPIIRRYLDEMGVTRTVLSVAELESVDDLPPSGDVLWITGASIDDDEFTTRPLNDVGSLEPIAGDLSLGGDFVIPLYAVTSSYDSSAELERQAATIAELPFLIGVS